MILLDRRRPFQSLEKEQLSNKEMLKLDYSTLEPKAKKRCIRKLKLRIKHLPK